MDRQPETSITGLSRRSRGLPGRSRGPAPPRAVPCQICGSDTLPGLDLGQQPISDRVLTEGELNQPETFYPLKLQHCPVCGLTQLSYVPDPREVYKYFPFVSGTTRTATRHLQSLPPQLVKMAGLDASSFAVDIGSNDGTLLKAYRPFGMKFLGVDPSGDPVRLANEQGIETLHAFFNEETAGAILERRGKAHAMSACGVFGHIADLAGVMKGVKLLLAKGGIFATDNQYWMDMVLKLHYDNMFHQHLRYYSLRPLIHLFRMYDMDVFDVQRSDVYGGSIRVFSCHRGDYKMTRRLKSLLALEEKEKLYDPGTQQQFARNVEKRRRQLFQQVYALASKKKKVVGIGAPAKATTICNYCRIGPDMVEYMAELNPLLFGKYLPGVHIPIVEEERMFADRRKPDAGILFAWNYYDEIVPKLRKRGFKGKILLP